ncbi:hypothetical protein TNCV_1788861 [Trichonephila clavipes]|nr:hypothetical protein TNCV_1788861 [Trichonephila clavipes]
MQVSVTTECDPYPNHCSTTSVTVPFNNIGLMISGTSRSLQLSRRSESLSSVNLDSSVKSIEANRCLVQETCSPAQNKWSLLCRLLRGTHTTGRFA